jgi:hypothetical protein
MPGLEALGKIRRFADGLLFGTLVFYENCLLAMKSL